MLQQYKNGQTSVILRVKLRNSTDTAGAGLTGLTSASSGLIISTIADVEATPTAYTVAASKIESITTLGTYAAPTATKVRFKEVDATNHPGIYEIQLADARFAVANARELTVSILGATNLAQCDVKLPLIGQDQYDPRFGLATDCIAWGVVGSGSTLTNIVIASISPAMSVTDELKGKNISFPYYTTTVGLRCQSSDITGVNTVGPALTVTSLTTIPQAGDIFIVE